MLVLSGSETPPKNADHSPPGATNTTAEILSRSRAITHGRLARDANGKRHYLWHKTAAALANLSVK